jgi:hypothetical protein
MNKFSRAEVLKFKADRIPAKLFLFAGEAYVPRKTPFTVYEEFEDFSELLDSRDRHLENGLNVLYTNSHCIDQSTVVTSP